MVKPLPGDLSDEQFVDYAFAAAFFNLSLDRFRKVVAAKKIEGLPPPVRISGRKCGFRMGWLREVARQREEASRIAA